MRWGYKSELGSNHLSYVPRMIFFTRGKGVHKDYLTSFESALRDASIGDLNLVFVSSIKPPQCKIVSKDEGRKHLKPGQIAFTVMARSATNEPNRLIAASIGLARPVDDMQYGYLSEHHSTGETAQKAGDYSYSNRFTRLYYACLGSEGGTMEAFGKNLQDTEFYAVCAGPQGWTVDNCS